MTTKRKVRRKLKGLMRSDRLGGEKKEAPIIKEGDVRALKKKN